MAACAFCGSGHGSFLYSPRSGTSQPLPVAFRASLLACGIVQARYRKNGRSLFRSTKENASRVIRSWLYWTFFVATPEPKGDLVDPGGTSFFSASRVSPRIRKAG